MADPHLLPKTAKTVETTPGSSCGGGGLGSGSGPSPFSVSVGGHSLAEFVEPVEDEVDVGDFDGFLLAFELFDQKAPAAGLQPGSSGPRQPAGSQKSTSRAARSVEPSRQESFSQRDYHLDAS